MSGKGFHSDDSQPSVTSHLDVTHDVKPDVTLLGQTVAGMTSVDSDDTSESDAHKLQPSTEIEVVEKKVEKKGKKGKKVGMKGLKQGVPGNDESFTMGMLSAGRGQSKMQAAHLTPSLLEEVLNDKKRALLRSPEVLNTLGLLQSQVLEENEKQLTEGEGAEEKAQPNIHKTTTTCQHYIQQHEQQSQNKDIQQTQIKHPASTTKPPPPGAGGGAGGGGIWSKEGSAFTSVNSSNT